VADALVVLAARKVEIPHQVQRQHVVRAAPQYRAQQPLGAGEIAGLNAHQRQQARGIVGLRMRAQEAFEIVLGLAPALLCEMARAEEEHRRLEIGRPAQRLLERRLCLGVTTLLVMHQSLDVGRAR